MPAPDKIGTSAAAALRDRAATATAGLPALRAGVLLAAVGPAAGGRARPQRPLWASTSVKDPAYPDTRYVTDLVAPGALKELASVESVPSASGIGQPAHLGAADRVGVAGRPVASIAPGSTDGVHLTARPNQLRGNPR
jgi:hypothetical protein